MEVRAVLPHQGEPVSGQLSELIGTIGTSSFEPILINFTRQTIGCDHVTAFAHSARSAPRVLLAANAGAQPLARLMAKKYLSNYWQMGASHRDGQRANELPRAQFQLLGWPVHKMSTQVLTIVAGTRG